jgi:hypothetical protein
MFMIIRHHGWSLYDRLWPVWRTIATYHFAYHLWITLVLGTVKERYVPLAVRGISYLPQTSGGLIPPRRSSFPHNVRFTFPEHTFSRIFSSPTLSLRTKKKFPYKFSSSILPHFQFLPWLFWPRLCTQSGPIAFKCLARIVMSFLPLPLSFPEVSHAYFCSTLKMEAASYSETSITYNQTTWQKTASILMYMKFSTT